MKLGRGSAAHSPAAYSALKGPDPNVRNDDHRLQYDITYRVSLVLGMSLECTRYIIIVSSQISSYVTNSKSIMDYCKVSVANGRSRLLRLVGWYVS